MGYHLRSSAPCLLTSLYRSLWGEYHVQTSLYRSPLWVRSYGQLQCLPTSLYRSPMAGTKLADLSLQTTLCKEDGKKRV
jgi:hypothetical protein